MRVATWNLQRGGPPAVVAEQRRVLDSVGADIVVLTEVPARWEATAAGPSSPLFSARVPAVRMHGWPYPGRG